MLNTPRGDNNGPAQIRNELARLEESGALKMLPPDGRLILTVEGHPSEVVGLRGTFSPPVSLLLSHTVRSVTRIVSPLSIAMIRFPRLTVLIQYQKKHPMHVKQDIIETFTPEEWVELVKFFAHTNQMARQSLLPPRAPMACTNAIIKRFFAADGSMHLGIWRRCQNMLHVTAAELKYPEAARLFQAALPSILPVLSNSLWESNRPLWRALVEYARLLGAF